MRGSVGGIKSEVPATREVPVHASIAVWCTRIYVTGDLGQGGRFDDEGLGEYGQSVHVSDARVHLIRGSHLNQSSSPTLLDKLHLYREGNVKKGKKVVYTGVRTVHRS
jgi:hypothetical protein